MAASQQAELDDLKMSLRSLVVSSPVGMDLRALSRDYFSFEGKSIPYMKYGCTSLVTFIRERCSDVFVLHGDPNNPVVTPIVTNRTQHLDQLMSKQRISSNIKHKMRRRTVRESDVCHTQQTRPEIIRTDNRYSNVAAGTNPAISERRPFQHSIKENKYNVTEHNQKNNVRDIKRPIVKAHSYEPVNNHNRPIVKQQIDEPQKSNYIESTQKAAIPMPVHVKSIQKAAIPMPVHVEARKSSKTLEIEEQKKLETDSSVSETSLQVRTDNINLNFRYNILYLNDVKSRLEELMFYYPRGIWLQDLNRLYREKFECDIDYQRLSYSTLVQMLRDMSDVVRVKSSEQSGELAVVSAEHTGPLNLSRFPKLDTVRTFTNFNANVSVESEEALPGVPYDEGIFPEDCMGFRESIPKITVQELEVGGEYEVNISEVLDPSHFWFQLRGKQYDIALNTLMDEMLEYYTVGEGKNRQMEFGAAQIGQYCATKFGDDGWHRSLIVQVDSEAVKVRHVDYGSVEKVARRDLRVLPRRWGTLPVQALRGCLPRVKPAVVSGWTYQAGTRFLDLVYCKPLYAKVHSVDTSNQIVRLLLVDTNTDKDINISAVLIMEGFAELLDVPPEILEDFLLPSFDDLENGRAMNLSEKSRLVTAGAFPEGHDAPFSLPLIIRTKEPLASDGQCGTPHSQWQRQHEVTATTDHAKQYVAREDDQLKERSVSTSAANTLPLHTLSGCSSEMTISHLSIADSVFTDDNSTNSSRIASPMDLRKCKSRSFLCSDETSTASSYETLCCNPATTLRVFKPTSQLHKFTTGPTFASIERKMAQSEAGSRIPFYIPTHSDTQSTEELNCVQATCTNNWNCQKTKNNDAVMRRGLDLEPQQPKAGVSQHVHSFMNTAADCLQSSRKASCEHVQPYIEYVPDHYRTSTESRHVQPSMQYTQQYSQSNDQCSITHDSSNGMYPYQNGQSNYMYPTEHVPLSTQYYSPGYVQPNSQYAHSYHPLASIPSTYPPGFYPPVRPPPGLSPAVSYLGLSRLETEAIACSMQPAYPEVANRLLQESIGTANPTPHWTAGCYNGAP